MDEITQRGPVLGWFIKLDGDPAYTKLAPTGSGYRYLHRLVVSCLADFFIHT